MSVVNRKRGGPLEGVRVLELSKIWAGPETGKHFAFLGAEVIKIESESALDGARIFNVKDLNKAPGFQSVNPQKLSAQIDVKSEKGIELILDLVRESDIIVENLRPGAMERLGLGYEVVKAANPEIVYISMSMWGNDGPLSYQTGYAPCFAALGGLSVLVGYQGEWPTGINIRYADSTYGTAAAYAGLVALIHQRNTGVGQYVDVSAVETMTSMIADSVLDYTMNGVEHDCDGNKHADMAPHGVFRCANDAWISIAARDDEAWQHLCEVMGQPELATDNRFSCLSARKQNEAELDRIIGEWTRSKDALELTAQLQSAAVAAGKSQNTIDLVSDQTLWQREFYTDITEFDGFTKPIPGPSARLGRPAAIVDGAPKLGDHTQYVLSEILGLSEDEQRELAEQGITR